MLGKKKAQVNNMLENTEPIKPELATLVDTPPSGPNWIHEIKFDGYRILSVITKKSIVLLTRNGKDWASHFPTIVKSLESFKKKGFGKNCILDGELVVLDAQGRSRFQLLQNALTENKSSKVVYFVFDLPYFQGKNLSQHPLVDRKKYLKTLFKQIKPSSNIVLTQFIQGDGAKVYKKACQHGLEGIISKDISSHYEQKRTRHWLKIKCGKRQEFIIVGFTKPRGSRHYFAALLLAVYDRKKLTYCGRVGTGFNEKSLEQIYKKMTKLKINHSPLERNAPTTRLKEIQWIKPSLAGEVAFTEWTEEGALRHPSFLGLRLDKDVKTIKKETAKKRKKSTIKKVSATQKGKKHEK